MQWLDEIPGLEQAKATRSFMRLGYESEDFAIPIKLAWVIIDSIRTMFAIYVDCPDTSYQVDRAWLTDDLGNAAPLASIHQLSPEGAAATGYPKHQVVLTFGPIAREARKLRLELQRLERGADGLEVLSPVVDPFAPMSEEDALHVMAWEEPDDPLTPVPVGTIAGCWAFEIPAPKHKTAWDQHETIPLNITYPLGDVTLLLQELQRGVTGWRLTSKFTTPATADIPEIDMRNMLWENSSPEATVAILAEQGLLPEYSPPVLSYKLHTESATCEQSQCFGPLTPLNNKFYHFFPPTPATPTRLSLTRIQELPIDDIWTYTFDPRTMATEPSHVVYNKPPLAIDLDFSVEGLYWEEEFMLIRPLITMRAESQATITIGDCLVKDPQGNEFYCQGQTLVDVPNQDTQAYGWQFAPLHRKMRQATFEAHTINVVPAEPISIDLKPAEPVSTYVDPTEE